MMSLKKKYYFHLTGVAVVSFWLFMIALLVKKVHVKEPPAKIDGVQLVGKIDSYQREWKEIYFKDKKVGYAVNVIKPFDLGYFIQEEIFLKLNLMGMASSIYTATQCQVDNQFFLKNFNFRTISGAVSFNISGRVAGDHLIVKTGKGKGAKDHRIRLSSPPMIGAGLGPFFRFQEIKIGQTLTIPIFDPSTMAQKEVVIHVVAKEDIKINRRTFNAFRLETEIWGKKIIFWLDEDGTTLKEEGFMGLTTVKSSAANAPRDLGAGEGVDIYEMTAVNVDRELRRPTGAGYLKLRIDGLDKITLDKKIWNGGRQRFYRDILEITRERLPVRDSYSLPYDDPHGKMRTLLEPEFNIESNNEEIIDQAREIAGDDMNALSVSRKLMKWVYHKLEKKPVVSVPSALEVLKTGVGDCNEHATLLTALLRAVGIPARLSIGLVYTRKKFFYHAWTEAYVGGWVSMDATMNQMPVDATHVKLLEGNLEKQVEIAGLIGVIKLKVLDYR